MTQLHDTAPWYRPALQFHIVKIDFNSVADYISPCYIFYSASSQAFQKKPDSWRCLFLDA
jgi:hypothetical protein